MRLQKNNCAMNAEDDRRFVGKSRRLAQVFQNYANPIYFVTAVSAKRQAWLADDAIHAALLTYGTDNARHGRAIGRYVIMPDHLHFFVRLMPEAKLGVFVKLLKQALTKTARGAGNEESHLWQPGFFDHLVRHSESYAEKWQYVLQNPVRAGLVSRAEEWPYQGEIVRLDM